jgi:hypothetical protein
MDFELGFSNATSVALMVYEAITTTKANDTAAVPGTEPCPERAPSLYADTVGPSAPLSRVPWARSPAVQGMHAPWPARVRVGDGSPPPLPCFHCCVQTCSGHGVCLPASGVCECHVGYTGAACGGCSGSHTAVGTSCVFLPGVLVSCSDSIMNGG